MTDSEGPYLQTGILEEWEERRLREALSPAVIRELVGQLIQGGNYREISERYTRERLLMSTSWLLHVAYTFKCCYGDSWRSALLRRLEEQPLRSQEQYLRLWLLGLTRKTAQNVGISREEEEEFLSRMVEHAGDVASAAGLQYGPLLVRVGQQRPESMVEFSHEETLWLMAMVGALTLTIRGSQKSFYGKRLEKAFLHAALLLLGLREPEDFSLAIGRDIEVEREVNGEVRTKRGMARIDMSLIGQGNQEVSEDKLNRVGRNGIVLVDKLGGRSQVPETARRHGVKIIQIRHHFPVTEMYEHLQPLVETRLTRPPKRVQAIRRALAALPDQVFSI
jgi:hypothetical protein